MSKDRASTSSPYFDEASMTWDQNPLVRELADAAASSLVEHIVLHDELIVMEYGCGTGLIWFFDVSSGFEHGTCRASDHVNHSDEGLGVAVTTSSGAGCLE